MHGSQGAQSRCLLLPTDLVNGPTIKAKPNSKVIHNAVRRLSNTKRGAAKGRNTFPFLLHYSSCPMQREKQRRIKKTCQILSLIPALTVRGCMEEWTWRQTGTKKIKNKIDRLTVPCGLAECKTKGSIFRHSHLLWRAAIPQK